MKRQFSIHADMTNSTVVLVLGLNPIGVTRAKFLDPQKAMRTIGTKIREGKKLNRNHWHLFSDEMLDMKQTEFTRLRKMFGEA